MLTLLIAAYAVNNEYVLQSTYTTFTFVTGRAGFINMNLQFLVTYGLTEGFVLDEDDLPVLVVFFDADQWALLLAFSVTDAFICSNPCSFLTFPL